MLVVSNKTILQNFHISNIINNRNNSSKNYHLSYPRLYSPLKVYQEMSTMVPSLVKNNKHYILAGDFQSLMYHGQSDQLYIRGNYVIVCH